MENRPVRQEYAVVGTLPFPLGATIHGFNFWEGEEVKGKVVDIKPYIVFGYVLDTGSVLGPYDDVYTRRRESDDRE